MFKLPLLSILCALSSCGSAVAIQSARLVYDLPGQVNQMEKDRIELESCVKEKRCSAYYFDANKKVWITHRYSQEELTDQQTAREDNSECFKIKKCFTYKVAPLPELFVHKYDEEELKTLEDNRLYKLEMDRIADENDRMFHRGKYGQ